MRRVAWTVALLMPGLLFGQSLGEVARKEKERRKSEQKAKEYTEDDLKKLPPVQMLAPAEGSKATPAPAGARRSAGSSDSAGDARKTEEAEWRQRAAAARAHVEQARKHYETLSNMSIVPGQYWVDERGRPVYTTVEQLQKATAQAKADLAAAEQALERLEEDARRRNIPPGWLR